MFSSVHILFLLSLGVFSWAILCYFKEIENRLMCIPTNRSQDPPTDVAVEEFIHQIPSRCQDNRDFYVNFLCVFVCIYALAKIAHMAERYLASHMYRKFYVLRPNNDGLQSIRSVDNCEQISQKNFQMKIEELEKQNIALKFKLRETGQDVSTHVAKMSLQPGDGLLQNVYISNGHIRVKQNVYVNGDCILEESHNVSQNIDRSNEVWPKYLSMQRVTHKKPASLWTNIRGTSNIPIVLSTQELQEFHGIV